MFIGSWSIDKSRRMYVFKLFHEIADRIVRRLYQPLMSLMKRKESRWLFLDAIDATKHSGE
jgi:hypothetical protein